MRRDTAGMVVGGGGTAGAVRQVQQQGEQMQVLGNGAIPEVKLGPIAVAGATPGMEDFQSGTDRALLDPTTVAPVVADATNRQPRRTADMVASADDAEEQPREEQFFVVLASKQVLDKTAQARTSLREGKVISDKHYDIRHLQAQGVKLKRATKEESGVIEELLG